MNDDEDPVVQELDVYLNRVTDPDAELYVLQYPLRPVYRPYGDHGQLALVQKGETSGRLRLTYLLTSESAQYDAAKRSQLASLRDLHKSGKLDSAGQKELDSLTLHHLYSSEAADECHYALGFIKDNNFYISPVSHVLQFRPDFRHLDFAVEVSKKRVDDNETKDEASTKPTDVTLADSRMQQSNAETRRKLLNEVFEDIAEPFDEMSVESARLVTKLTTFPIKYKHVTTAEESSLSDLLGDSTTQTSPSYELRTKRVTPKSVQGSQIPKILFDTSYPDYLGSLCKECALATLAGTRVQAGQEETDAGLGTGPLSYLALSRLSLSDQVKRILCFREVETLANVKNLITKRNVPDGQLVEELCKVSIPLKGLWIVKSDVLYGDEASKWTPLEILTRDLIICIYNQNKKPPRSAIQNATPKLPAEKVARAYNSLFRVIDNQVKDRVEPNAQCRAAFPTLFSQHEGQWTVAKAGEISKGIKEFNDKEEARQRSIAVGDNSHQLIDALDPVRVKKAVEKAMLKLGACKEEAILTEVRRTLKISIEEEIKSRLTAEMTAGAGSSVVQRQRILEQYDKMSKALDTVQVDDLRLVLTECALNMSGLWVLQKWGNPQIDSYRKILHTLYINDPTKLLTTAEFTNYAQDILKKKSNLPDSEVRRFFREVAVNEEGRWRFKGCPTPASQDGDDDTS